MTAPLKVLLLGPGGQVGWELQRSLAPLGEVVAVHRHSGPLCGDLAQPDALAQTVRTVRPDVIVNAAAYTAVDQAEREPELAHAINAVAPGVLAQEAEALGAWLVHYSTDYVFNGQGDRPWTEQDPTGPLNVYGQTKREGEVRIARACPRHLIFRTSWVYAARGGNFAKTMLRLARERDELKVVNDQHGAPTGAELLADATAHALRQVFGTPAGAARTALAGTYHLAASGETTWHGYALAVLAAARQMGVAIRAQQVHPVASGAFPTPAKRPQNSRLSTQKFQAAFGLHLPAWESGVQRMLAEHIASEPPQRMAS